MFQWLYTLIEKRLARKKQRCTRLRWNIAHLQKKIENSERE